jgi:hypothetical protein
MPINYLNAPVMKPDYAPYENFFSNMIKGYQTGQKHSLEQAEGKEKVSEQEMKNALLKEFGRPREQAEIDYLQTHAPEAESRIALNRAHENYYQQGGGRQGALSTMGKLLRERAEMADEFGEDSAQVQAIDEYTKKLSGLGSGLTGATRTRETNAGLANQQRLLLDPYMQHKYQGAGSNALLASDLHAYNNEKDPVKKLQIEEDLVNAGVATKLAPEFAGFQLVGQSIQPTVHALESQKKALKQGWAEGLNVAVNNLPKNIQEKINKRHSQILKESSGVREQEFKNLLSRRDPNQEVAGQDDALKAKNMERIKAAESGLREVRNSKTGEIRFVTPEEARKMGAK